MLRGQGRKMGDPINSLSIEKEHFSHFIEPSYSQLLSQIDEIKEDWILGKEKYRLSYYEKKELALHIATQYFAFTDNYLTISELGKY